ncbi:MAG: hypothetical protein WCX69_06005 [Candidatus Paceibacterota bacterium]
MGYSKMEEVPEVLDSVESDSGGQETKKNEGGREVETEGVQKSLTEEANDLLCHVSEVIEKKAINKEAGEVLRSVGTGLISYSVVIEILTGITGGMSPIIAAGLGSSFLGGVIKRTVKNRELSQQSKEEKDGQ